MNKLLPLLAFSVLLLVPVGLDNAFAATIEITDEASCLAAGGSFFDGTTADGCSFDSLTVNAGDTLRVENLIIQPGSGGFTNFGNVMLIGDDEQNSATIVLSLDGDLVNECGGTITIEGGDGFHSGGIQAIDLGEIVTNFGTITLNGGDGQQSGEILFSDTLNNHGTINENPGSGPSSGIVILVGNAVFNDNLPNNCPSEIVGGELMPIETTTLILAGAQTFSWMIPVILSVLGIGLFVVSRKSE